MEDLFQDGFSSIHSAEKLFKASEELRSTWDELCTSVKRNGNEIRELNRMAEENVLPAIRYRAIQELKKNSKIKNAFLLMCEKLIEWSESLEQERITIQEMLEQCKITSREEIIEVKRIMAEMRNTNPPLRKQLLMRCQATEQQANSVQIEIASVYEEIKRNGEMVRATASAVKAADKIIR
jgi:hypothetical protein